MMIEIRYLRHLKLNVKTKAHVEASICNAYLTEEASHFVSHYFESNVRCRIRDLPRNDDGSYNNDRSGILSIFTHPIRFYGKGKVKIMDEADIQIAHRYILMNCQEIDPIVAQFRHSVQTHQPNYTTQQLDEFVQMNFVDCFKASVCVFFFLN